MAHSQVTVDIQHAFGSHCRSGFSGAALFADESGHHVLHPVGRRIAIRHVETQEVSVLGGSGAVRLGGDGAAMCGTSSSSSSACYAGSDDVDSLSFCAASRERTLLAVGERRGGGGREPYSAVAIWDLSALGAASTPLKEVKALKSKGPKLRLAAAAFSPPGGAASSGGESRFLAVLVSTPEAALMVLDWRGDQVLCSTRLDSPADHVSWAPQADSCMLSISGPQLLRLVQLKDALSKIRDSSLKVFPAFQGLDNSEGARIVDHCWVDAGGENTLVACTTQGKVLVLCPDRLVLTSTIEAAFGPGHDLVVPSCLQRYSQGFLLGGGEGMVAVWERDDTVGEESAGAEFKLSQAVRVARAKTAAVTSVELSSTEEQMLFGFRSGDVGTMSFGSLLTEAGGGEALCSVISGGFHGGPIASLDMAVHRPWAVTVGKKDGLIRIWNYATRQCEICWQSEQLDPPSIAALHPFGYLMAVCFNAKLRFYHVLAKTLQVCAEFGLSGVKILRFSNGGHLLAAVQGKVVHIFSLRTMAKRTSLHGHAHVVSSVCFDPEDTTLWTCGADGQLFAWDPLSGERKAESISTQSEYFAASSGQNGQVVCSMRSGQQHSLVRLDGTVKESEEELPKDQRVSSLCQCAGLAATFAGTIGGKLWTFASHSEFSRDQSLELGLHSGSCTAICASPDGRTVFTAGEDGAVFMLSVSGLAQLSPGGAVAVTAAGTKGAATPGDDAASAGGAAPTSESVLSVAAAEAVLARRDVLQKRLGQVQKLRSENYALRMQLEEERERLEAECLAKVEEARRADQAEIQELSRRRDAVDKASTAKKRESERVLRSMSSSHTQAAEQLQNLYEKKVSFEQERYGDLLAEQSRLEAQIEAIREQTRAQLEREDEEAKVELEQQLAARDVEIQKHKDMVALIQNRFQGLLTEGSTEHDVELSDIDVQARRKLREQKEVEQKLRREQDTLLTGLEMMEEDRVVKEKEQQEMTVTIRGLREQKEELTRTLRSLEAERKERKGALEDKEEKIASYKDKVNTLKKFRHVLNQQLLEVTESLQPKDQLIKQLHGGLEELEGEFEKHLAEQRDMEQELGQKRQQLSLVAQEGKDLKEVIAEKDRLIIRFTYDLHALVNCEEDIKKWPQEIRRIYHTYVSESKGGEDRLPLESMHRQMNQVERRAATLTVKNGQMREKCKTDIQRKAHENAQLVHDVNLLRKDKQSLLSSHRALQKRLRELEGRGSPDFGAEDSAIPALPPPSPPLLDRPGSAMSAAGSALSAGATMPRVPSGSLPGPRQQQSAAARTPEPKRQARMRSVPPLGKRGEQGGAAGGSVRARASQDDVIRLQAVLDAPELSSGNLELQRSESAMIRERIATLLKGGAPVDASAAVIAAGAGLAG